MTGTELITKIDNLNALYQDPNFSSNKQNEYDYLDELKNTVFTNYESNVTNSNNITNKIEDLKRQFEGRAKKIDDISQRKLEINRYYILKYTKEISLLQKIVLICGAGLIGCLLFNIGLISNLFLSLYLGIVLAIGFVIVFYNLWDIYIRDNIVFDEYNYGMYGSKSPTNVTPVNDDKYDTNELSNLKC